MSQLPFELSSSLQNVKALLNARNQGGVYNDVLALMSKARFDIEETGYDGWNGGTYRYTLHVRLSITDYAPLQDDFKEVFTKTLEGFLGEVTQHGDSIFLDAHISPTKDSVFPKIPMVVRREIFDSLQLHKISWNGNLEIVDFLERLYDLESLPSHDDRYQGAARDIIQHVVNNDDWEHSWIYTDKRFNLLTCPENDFVAFINEVVHPIVRGNEESIIRVVNIINQHLQRCGLYLKKTGKNADLPIYTVQNSPEDQSTQGVQSKAFKIYFGNRNEGHTSIPKSEPWVYFYPSNDRWNDFGYHTGFHYIMSGELEDHSNVGFVKLSFLGSDVDVQSNPASKISEKLKEKKTKFLQEVDLPQFFCIHKDIDSYRHLVELKGPEKAVAALESMCDLVAIKSLDLKPSWYESALNTEAFSHSFMRQAETYFAFQYAGSVLNGVRREEKASLIGKYYFELQSSAGRSPCPLLFSFGDDWVLPERTVVLIGKNGMGKSRTLNQIAKLLTGGESVFADIKGQPLRMPLNMLLAVASPGETAYTFPSETGREFVNYKRMLLGRTEENENTDALVGMVVDLVRRRADFVAGQSRWELFYTLIRESIDVDRLVLPIRSGARYLQKGHIKIEDLLKMEKRALEAFADVDLKQNIMFDIGESGVPLSSGQLTFLSIAAALCQNIENGTLVLMDEPEVHLHPNLIATLTVMLNKLLELTGSLAIVATHSAYFVREYSRNQVLVFTQNDSGDVEVSNPRLKTVGADIGAISDYVFADSGGVDFVDRVLNRIENEEFNSEQKKNLLDELKGEISSELYAKIMYRIGGSYEKIT